MPNHPPPRGYGSLSRAVMDKMKKICLRKKRYETREDADEAAAAIGRPTKRGSKRLKMALRSYRCQACGRYHITSIRGQEGTVFNRLVDHMRDVLARNAAKKAGRRV